MAQVSTSIRERQSARLKHQVAAMMQEMLDDLIADCESGKQIAAETWLQDAAASDYLLRYGEGELAAYNDIIDKLKALKGNIDDAVKSAERSR